MADLKWVNQTELAAILDVTDRTIRSKHDVGMPHERKGNEVRYPTAKAVEWYYREKFGVMTESSAKARKIAAQAKLAEIEVRKAEGEIIPTAVHIERLSLILDRLRARLTAAPGAWAPRLVGLKTVPNALARMRELVNELLTALNAAADEIIPDVDEDIEDAAA